MIPGLTARLMLAVALSLPFAPVRAAPTETVLYLFRGAPDGSEPNALIFDAAGNLYGTTSAGGPSDDGTVFELTPPGAGETRWTEKLLHRFKAGVAGKDPSAGLIMDANGAFYGTTTFGGEVGCVGCGTVFELTPPGAGETRWTEKVLYRFKGGAAELTPPGPERPVGPRNCSTGSRAAA